MTDLFARAERKLRVRQPRRKPGGLAELYELGDEVVRRVAVLDEMGRMRECIRVALRVLGGAGCADEALSALTSDGRWVDLFLSLIAVGEGAGIWSGAELCEGGGGAMAPVWRALKAQGSAAVMAVYLARFRESAGDAELRRALREIGWDSSGPASPRKRQSKAAKVGASNGAFTELVDLNVNQWTGKRTTDGWYDPEADELVLLRSRIGTMYNAMMDRGLLLSRWRNVAAKGHVFDVRAGSRTFRNAVAVDIEKLRELAPAEMELATGRWTNGSLYPVAPVAKLAAEDSAEACPACGSGLLVRAGTHGRFYACKKQGCGFSAQATEDGRLPEPAPCEKCGGDRYRTLRKGRMRWTHVRPCTEEMEGKVVQMPRVAAS